MSWVLMLDDQRDYGIVRIPEKYDCYEKVLVKTYNEFVDIIKKRGLPKAVFFDHDLGLQAMKEITRKKFLSFDYSAINGERTGYDAAKFLINYCEENKIKLCDYYSQSMNPVGRKNILDLLNKYKESKENNGKN